MKKIDNLNLPNIALWEACLSQMKKGRRERFQSQEMAFSQEFNTYDNKAKKQKLYEILPILEDWKGFSEKELKALYKSDVIKKCDSKAREIYDTLKQLNGQKCPYCGGIGSIETIDHYLPISDYPLFAVCLSNLVPTCRDCNFNKRDNTFVNYHQQTLHPYFDKSHFFQEQWIFAKRIADDELSFFIQCPESWSINDKKRVENHVKQFDILRRYGIVSTEEISNLIDTRNKKFGKDENMLREHAREKLSILEDSYFPNHWRLITLQAFC